MVSSKPEWLGMEETLKPIQFHPTMDRDTFHTPGCSKSARGDHKESLKTESGESLKQKKTKKPGEKLQALQSTFNRQHQNKLKRRIQTMASPAGGAVTAPQDGKWPCWNSSDFQGITGVLCLVCCLPPCVSQTVSKHRL